jgi:glycosyltransferase involved in cell wall biosynthesis
MELCEKNSPDFFEGCCPTLIRVGHGRKPMIASRLPALARWRLFAANQPGRIRRASFQTVVGIAERILGAPETTSLQEKKSFFLTATQRIFRSVDRFIAPSAYLRNRFIACGLPADRILHLPYGIRHFDRPAPAPRKDDRLHFGYIGAFHPHKGVHLLLDAFRGLGHRATLDLHGCSFNTPVSEAHFKRSTTDPVEGVVVHGRYQNNEVYSILSHLDVVVVPSIWYENSPLTIQEAQLAGVPVITADVGGMAELVQDGINGRLFRCNDSTDLRRVIIEIIENPQQLIGYKKHAPEVLCIMNQARKVRALYQSLI